MLLLLWRLVIEEGSGISVSKSQLLSQPKTQRMVYLYCTYMILSCVICCLLVKHYFLYGFTDGLRKSTT